MKVLVTGSTGFTGGKLAMKLYQLGVSVKVLIRDKSKVECNDSYYPEIIEGDIRDMSSVVEAVNGCEKIFHLAACYRTAGLPDKTYRDIHVKGTENLLKAAHKFNVQRFVHCSTVGVHGHIDNAVANEMSPFSPGDIYQETKLEGELCAKRFFDETKLPISIIRPTAIYGPGDLRLLKLFKLAGKMFTPILGNGQIYYHMIYIDDLVDAFVRASEDKNAIGEAFIIGGSERKTLNEIVDIISSGLGTPSFKIHLPASPFQLLGSVCEKICTPLKIEPPIYRRRVDFFTKSRSFDTSKSQKILGFFPKVAIEKGLNKTAAWYKDKGLL